MSKTHYKKKNPSPSTWQVWCTYIKFEGNIGGKRRPVVIVKIAGDLCHVAEISGRSPSCKSDVLIKNPIQAGLDKESIVQTSKIRVIKKGSLEEYIGYLLSDDIHRIEGFLGAY